MTFPFLSLFKKAKAKALTEAEEQPPPALVPAEKSSADRLSKTVMPNATRTIPSAGAFSPWLNSVTAADGGPAPAGSRTVSFGASGSQGQGLPPAVALALEPRVERAISLELAEVIAQMPEGFVRPLEPGEAKRTVLLKAAEIERGMANGRPTVSMATIYQQLPSLFVREVAPSDPTQLPLPFEKVLDQFTKLQVRSDQYREQVVPFVETPFLRVTLEDDTKFGTSIGPIETAPTPTVRMELATAETIAAANPEAAQARSSAAPPPTPRGVKLHSESERSISLNGKSNGNGPAAPPAPAVPSRIHFDLSPKGADVPATERVPASGGPSVPNGASPKAPARIPFRISPSTDESGLPSEPWLTKDNLESEGEAAGETPATEMPSASVTADAPAIVLPLKAIMDMVTPFQVTGDTSTIPAEARVSLSFALIEPQLASGRVQLTPEQFAAALPEEYRALFDAKAAATPVSLPLHDVLSNLPATSLRMRDDQIEQEKGANFDTPFSAKAAEDARRFKVAGAPVPKPAVSADEEVLVLTEEDDSTAGVSIPAEAAGASPPTRTALQAALDTDDELDAKAVVSHVNKMPGVEACAIMFGDGLSLAGKLPEEFGAEGLCAMAPSLLERIENHMVETKLGALRAMTLSCTSAAVTFLMHDNLCLAALHPTNDLAAEVRERLGCVVHELSRKYSNPV